VTFGGVDPLLIGWATQHFGVRFALDTPADLANVAPLCQLQTIGGPSSDDFSGLVAATVSVDSFAADIAAASQLAWTVDDGLRGALPGATVSGITFTKVRTLTIPGRRPWNDIAVRRYGATYQIWLRRQPQ
jgi:hypothetical protein